MPRDNDKNNGRPPRRDGGGGKGRAGGPGGRGRAERPARSSSRRGDRKFGDKKFGDKKFGDKTFAGKRSSAPRGEGFRKDGPPARAPRSRDGDAPRPRFNRDDRPQRDDRGPRRDFGSRDRGEGRSFKPREDRGEGRSFKPREDRGEGRSFKPREDRGEGRSFKPRADRGEGRSFKPREDRGEGRSFKPRADRGEGRSFKPREDRGEGRSFKPREDRGEGRSFKPREDRGEGRSFKPREDRGEGRSFKPREDRGEGRSFKPREDRPARSFDRPPRRDFERGPDRGNDKPWEKRAPRRDDARSERPARADRGPRQFDRPREDRGEGRSFKPREERERSGFSRPREDRPKFDKPRGERPARPAHRTEWQEHPRNEERSRDDRPRRDNEDDTKIFAKRPAFGGRGAYRERPRDDERRPPRAVPAKKKSGERIAKLVARAGLCSRRDAEDWIVQGRVAVNGRVINSPALDVTANDVVTIDGKPLPERERTRLFLYHKPRGLMTTHDDPEGRPTVFDNLPEGLPRLISIGRLDFNTEGLLLLTNDGGLSRALEHPDTGWLRRYRVRAHGEVTQAQLDELKKGVEVDGVKYGPIEATLERDQGANVWLVFAIREGKNREVRNVMAHLGLEVNRLIRVSYGPFQLGEIAEGQVDEIKSRVLREQLGDKIVAMSGAQFDAPARAPKGEAAAKKTTRAVIADRKGRRVLVQRTGGDEARERNDRDAGGFGPPRRPQRGYKGKRDLKPRTDFTDD
jgi:23S rRNA pseudouridine2605 synthase